MLTVLLFIVSIAVIWAQLPNYKPQPWPVIIDGFGYCCSIMQHKQQHRGQSNSSYEMSLILNESNQLDTCVQKAMKERTWSTPAHVNDKQPVGLLSLASEGSGRHLIHNISLFRPYQVGAVGAYCEFKGYQFRSYTALEVDADEADYRWHKIRMLKDALDPVTGWAKGLEYIVWIDSDAVVLDFSLDIATIGSTYSEADLIASADIRLGLINSGVMIMRNTAWTRNFLSQWWSIADRNSLCDQEAFDILYRQSNGDKIKLLATDVLNSHPPAWKHYGEDNAMLHLMGESAAFRARVFKLAFTHVCNARSGGILRRQLGVNMQTMQQYAREVYRDETQASFKKANATGHCADIQALSQASHHYVDTLLAFIQSTSKQRPTVTNALLAEQMTKEVLNIREAVLKLILHQIEVLKQHPQGQIEELLELLKQAAEAGNSLFWTLEDLSDRVYVSSLVFNLLDELQSLTSEQSLGRVQHMRALMHQNLGIVYFEAVGKNASAEHLNHSIAALQQSVLLFQEYLANSLDSSVLGEHLHSLQVLAGALCQRDSSSVGWDKAIEKARCNTAGLQLGMHYEQLGLVLFNAAQCKAAAKEVQAASELLDESIHVFSTILEQKQAGAAASVESKRVHDLLLNAQNLLQHLQPAPAGQTASTSATGTAASASAAVEKVMKSIVTEDGVKYITAQGDQEEEWEECTDEDEGCEDFYIEFTPAAPSLATQHSNLHERNLSIAPAYTNPEAYLYLDLNAAEQQQLQQIRSQYQHVVHAQALYRQEHDISDLFLIFAEDANVHTTPSSAPAPPVTAPATAHATASVGKDDQIARQQQTILVLQAEVQRLQAENLQYKMSLMQIHEMARMPRLV